TLAEEVTAVAVAHGRFLLVQVEGLSCCGPHQPGGPVVGILVALRGQVRVAGQEIALDLLEQVKPGVDVPLAHPWRGRQVLDAQGAVGPALSLSAILADDQWSIARPEEPRTEGSLVEDAKWRHADEVGQLRLLVAQFPRDVGTDRRVLDRPLR